MEKEKNSEKENRKEIKEYLEALDAIREIDWLNEKKKEESYHYIAQEVLKLLPEEVEVFELSHNIYATRQEEKSEIKPSEIKDLDWVEKYCK